MRLLLNVPEPLDTSLMLDESCSFSIDTPLIVYESPLHTFGLSNGTVITGAGSIIRVKLAVAVSVHPALDCPVNVSTTDPLAISVAFGV